MTTNRNRVTGLDLALVAEVRRELARHRELSVSSLAQTFGMRRATLSVRFNGHVPFSPSLLSDVARAFGTTASVLVARAERACGILPPSRLGLPSQRSGEPARRAGVVPASRPGVPAAPGTAPTRGPVAAGRITPAGGYARRYPPA